MTILFEIVSHKVLVEHSNNPLQNIFELNQLMGGGFVLMPYLCVGPQPLGDYTSVSQPFRVTQYPK